MALIVIDARIINSSTGRYVERLLHYMQEIDAENKYVVLVRKKDETFWTPSAANFKVKVAEFDNYSFAEQIGFRRFLNKLHPDLVHFCMPQQPIFYRGTSVTTIHDLTLLHTYNSDKNWFIFHFKQFVGRFVFYQVARKNTAILSPTEYTKSRLVDFAHIDAAKVHVTPLAAEPVSTTRTVPYELPFSRFIMYVGQYPDYKNIRRLGDAHQKLLENHPDLGLVLVGKLGKDTRNTKTYFEARGYKNIHFTDFIPDEQRDWLYSNTAAYIFPSLMEGFGLPGLEAMAAGAPAVSSNASCLPEVYGDAAHYFDPKDTDDMVRAIDEVLKNDKLRATLIQKGYAQVKKYSWRRTAEQTHAVYLKALSKD